MQKVPDDIDFIIAASRIRDHEIRFNEAKRWAYAMLEEGRKIGGKNGSMIAIRVSDLIRELEMGAKP